MLCSVGREAEWGERRVRRDRDSGRWD